MTKDNTATAAKPTRLIASAVAVSTLLAMAISAKGQAVSLGSAANFAIISSQGISSSGTTVITGNIALSPLTSITGFTFSSTPGAGVVTGDVHYNDEIAVQAQTDALSTFNTLAGLSYTSNLTGLDLGGMILTPGVYYFSSSAGLSGNLTLNTEGNSNAVFTFLIGSTLTTSEGSSVVVTGATVGSNPSVNWQVGSSATLGTNTTFVGTILAKDSVSLGTDATIKNGSVIALTGAVTLLSNSISTIPEPSTWVLLFGGMGGLGVWMRMRRHTSASPQIAS
jgi:type VI secretion system secreted protein VgrG